MARQVLGVLAAARRDGRKTPAIALHFGRAENARVIAYRNFGGNSKARAYEPGPSPIMVHVEDSSACRYTAMSAGYANILRMLQLAEHGRGLNGFFNTQVKAKYAAKVV
jgi:hypothetical protein